MPSFPTFQFTRENVKVRFLDPTVSASVNQRFMGLPRGVYVGYSPSVTAGSSVLTLKIDTRLRFSSLKVGAVSKAVQLDIFTDRPVTLDFAGHTAFPVFVIARGDYVQNSPTQAQIITRTIGPSGPQEIAICVVDKPGADLTVSTTVPGNRQPPLAFDGQAFGYMYGGATTDLVTAQSVTAEVQYARHSLAHNSPPDAPETRLANRLSFDLSSGYIASQLGQRTVNIAGNSRLISAGTLSVNVSDSFGELTRQLGPKLLIPAGGNEAVIAPVGTVAMTTGLTTVTGTGTTFAATFVPGQYVQFANQTNAVYTIRSITSNTVMTLTTPFTGATTLSTTVINTGEGAITNPPDPDDRNVCFVIDEATGSRLVTTNGSPVYGRLNATNGSVPGTLTFALASSTAAGTLPLTGTLEVGDLILGADLKEYSVTSVVGSLLGITPPYQGPNASGFTSTYRRFRINFWTRDTGVESTTFVGSVFTIPTGPITIRFFFPAWFRADRAAFDATALMKKDGENPVEPVATAATAGRALLAVAGATAGGLYEVRSLAAPLGANNFHTLNFTGVGAAVALESAGIASVSVPGPPGPPGPGAAQGNPGIPGPPGPGLNGFVEFQTSALFGPGGVFNTPTPFSFSYNFAGDGLGNLVHAVVGFSMFDANPNYGLSNQTTYPDTGWSIAGLSISGTTASTTLQLGKNAKGRVFLGACY